MLNDWIFSHAKACSWVAMAFFKLLCVNMNNNKLYIMLPIYIIYIYYSKNIKILKFLKGRKAVFNKNLWVSLKYICVSWRIFFLPGWRLRLHCLNVILEILMSLHMSWSSFQRKEFLLRGQERQRGCLTSYWWQTLEWIRQRATLDYCAQIRLYFTTSTQMTLGAMS